MKDFKTYLRELQNTNTRKKGEAQLRTLIKRANQRLRQLEESDFSKSSNAYIYIQRLAYDNVDSLSTTKKGQIKFNTNIKNMTLNEKAHALKTAYDFLNAKTSTVRGIKKAYKKQKEKFEEAIGLKVSDEKYVEFWSNAILNRYKLIYGSERIKDLYEDVERYDLQISDVVKTLNDIGFTANTLEDDISYEDIELAIGSLKIQFNSEKSPFYKDEKDGFFTYDF